MPLILVVEDEKDLLDVLAYNLKASGYEVISSADGAGVLELARERLPDLVLLDLMLPEASGLDLCRSLKADPKTKHIPVIMVTAKGEEIDRVVGFELGADDYVVKPYSTRELLLRMQVTLRRGQSEASEAAGQPGGPPTRFGKLTIDREAYRVWVAGQEVTLTALEFRLLCTLYDRKNRVQSRSTLLDEVWGASEDMATRTVDTHVKRLREKLGQAGDYIETVRGVGYRFLEKPPEG
ncbi:MAG: response regulator transcription factor [Deltaproteobacteria bacterium]|nr:response regulator transcription factor [Deltaproteobacteria bacterium]